ncbi:hypothetical protein [Vibrio owensii]|uniref:hypothetical protein n=1 Tax=Vibrio owensii TaxID=696485 RepID=UPI0022DD7143|nr:hypothetical protein [Vibrio owensii]MDA0382960.1 hypothetical protein [Vibrio owensii]
MNNITIDQQVEELSVYANYLDESDQRKLVVWFELLRNALQRNDLNEVQRRALCQLMTDQCTPERCKNSGSVSFYVPYALRCYFILGDFSETSLKSMKALYALLDPIDLIEVLDCHFFYHQLFGFPKKLLSIIEDADKQSSQSSIDVQAFVSAIKDANAMKMDAFNKLEYLPSIESDSAWKKLPWLKWQLGTMKSVI